MSFREYVLVKVIFIGQVQIGMNISSIAACKEL